MQARSGQPKPGRERDGELRELAARRVVADLVARRERDDLRAEAVKVAARRLGVGERTLWRWVAAGRPPARRRRGARRLELSDELREAYLRLGGNVAAVWREAREGGCEPPPLRTLQQAFARELRPAERASARRGEGAGASTGCICASRRRIATRCGRPTTSSCRSWSSELAAGARASRG